VYLWGRNLEGQCASEIKKEGKIDSPVLMETD
jgi:alpha-tubulin suppressor-like RCC1 family protein